jgi:hypothetical protein
MAAGFGMRDYDARDLEAMFSLLRSLRVSAGDFAEPADRSVDGPRLPGSPAVGGHEDLS